MCHGSRDSPEYSASSVLPVLDDFCCHHILRLLRVVASVGHIELAKTPQALSYCTLVRDSKCPTSVV